MLRAIVTAGQPALSPLEFSHPVSPTLHSHLSSTAHHASIFLVNSKSDIARDMDSKRLISPPAWMLHLVRQITRWFQPPKRGGTADNFSTVSFLNASGVPPRFDGLIGAVEAIDLRRFDGGKISNRNIVPLQYSFRAQFPAPRSYCQYKSYQSINSASKATLIKHDELK